MTKVVYNCCFGGFGLSDEAFSLYLTKKGISHELADGKYSTHFVDDFGKHLRYYDISRTDPFLVEVVEELGQYANGPCADLRIVDVPEGSEYRIDEYDGNERVMMKYDYIWSVS